MDAVVIVPISLISSRIILIVPIIPISRISRIHIHVRPMVFFFLPSKVLEEGHETIQEAIQEARQ